MFAVALVATALGATACERTAERERRDTERAIAEATMTDARADEEAAKKTQAAEHKVAAQATQFLSAVNREKADATYRLRVAIDQAEKRLANLDADVKPDGKVTYDDSSKNSSAIQKLISRRDELKTDLDSIEVAAPHEWPALKIRIDRDIGSDRIRPIPVAPAPTMPITPTPSEETPGT
jgi:hypothetical protein